MNKMNNQIVKNYAEAFLEHFSKLNQVENLLNTSRIFLDLLMQDKETENLILKHNNIFKDNDDLIDKLIGKIDEKSVMKNIISFLSKKKRMDYLKLILEEIIVAYNKKNKIILAEIVSAFELEKSQYEKIKSSLEDRLKATIKLKNSVDPEMLGGIIIKIGDLIYDASIANNLILIKEKIIKKF